MGVTTEKQVEYLVVDTTAFIQNAPLQDVAENIVTVEEVVNEITNKRHLRRLCVLPYDLVIKDVDPEYVQIITDFSKKTGDYPSLSSTDIKVMALTYQLEKEHVGVEHLRDKPAAPKSVNVYTKSQPIETTADVTGFYMPGSKGRTRTSSCNSNSSKTEDVNENPENLNSNSNKTDEVSKNPENFKPQDINKHKDELESLQDKFKTLECSEEIQTEGDDVLVAVTENSDSYESEEDDGESDDEDSWITPSNVVIAKKQVNSELMEEKFVKVACMTTDFAMQNVLKQVNLNVSALDGRVIKQLRTYILRCYSCFGTTSIMTKEFCPKCGNKTLKRVAVSLDENGKQQIHINGRRPLTGRGKRFSLPTIKGGKHSNNPRLAEDQPMPKQKPSRLARTKNNPMEDDYIAGFSPFVMRDINSKSAQLCIRPGAEVKYWMRKNPNENRRHKK